MRKLTILGGHSASPDGGMALLFTGTVTRGRKMELRTDYDHIAATYDRRYEENEYPGDLGRDGPPGDDAD